MLSDVIFKANDIRGVVVGSQPEWDAAGALANAVIILVVGLAVLRTLRRFAHRLEPVVEFEGRSAQPVRLQAANSEA